jgi:hypothetical protein
MNFERNPWEYYEKNILSSSAPQNLVRRVQPARRRFSFPSEFCSFEPDKNGWQIKTFKAMHRLEAKGKVLLYSDCTHSRCADSSLSSHFMYLNTIFSSLTNHFHSFYCNMREPPVFVARAAHATKH